MIATLQYLLDSLYFKKFNDLTTFMIGCAIQSDEWEASIIFCQVDYSEWCDLLKDISYYLL